MAIALNHLLLVVALAQAPALGIGHTPTPDQLRLIDIDVTPDGKGLPRGSGTAAKGKDVYTRRCETCTARAATRARRKTSPAAKARLWARCSAR